MKQTIQLTESEMARLVREALNEVLDEGSFMDRINNGKNKVKNTWQNVKAGVRQGIDTAKHNQSFQQQMANNKRKNSRSNVDAIKNHALAKDLENTVSNDAKRMGLDYTNVSNGLEITKNTIEGNPQRFGIQYRTGKTPDMNSKNTLNAYADDDSMTYQQQPQQPQQAKQQQKIAECIDKVLAKYLK